MQAGERVTVTHAIWGRTSGTVDRVHDDGEHVTVDLDCGTGGIVLAIGEVEAA